MGPYRAGALADVAALDAPLTSSAVHAIWGLGLRVWGSRKSAFFGDFLGVERHHVG